MARKQTAPDDAPRVLFAGFDRPESNWFRMPNSWTDITAEINNLAELKVVEYILRHTWGYQEYDIKKHITIDEFVKGRRRSDGSRIDKGTGLSERAVYYGLQKAVEHGLIEQDVDDSDRGRVKKSYSLKMRDTTMADEPDGQQLQDVQSGVHVLHPPLQTSQPRGAKSAPRSEKDTLEKQTSSNIRRVSLDVDNSIESAPRRHAATPSQSENGGVEEIGAILTRRRGPRQTPQHDEAYQIIQAYIEDFRRELNDQATLKQSTMRAYHLYQRAGLSPDAFISQLYAARAIVKERTGNIRTRGDDTKAGLPTKHKAAYYFAVLADLLGLREDPTELPAQPKREQ